MKIATKQLTLTALLTSMIFVVTAFIPIQVPAVNGYINFGDALIFLSAFLINPLLAFLAGGLGSMFADLFLGYAFWAPATFLIKGLEGLLCGVVYFIFNKIKFKHNEVVGCVVGMTLGGFVMFIGYFFATWIIFNNFAIATLSLVTSAIQWIASIILCSIILSGYKFRKIFAFWQKPKTESEGGGNDENLPGKDGDNDKSI